MDISLNMESIKKEHPSICYNCDLARKPASDENRKNGYVGCCLRVLHPIHFDWDEITEAKEVGEGWVDLKARIDGNKSGVISNYQLLTLEVKSCNQFTGKYQ